MKLTKQLRLSLFAVSTCLIFFSLLSRAEEAATRNNGTITLFTGSGQCVIPLPDPGQTAVHKFPKKPPTGRCSSVLDGARFELREVPSATKIWFVNGRATTGQLDSAPKYCELFQNYSGSWNWYELLTIKNPTTIIETPQTQAPHTNDLSTLQEGQVVSPGLRLIKKVTTDTNLAKPYEINCIRIERSPAAPTILADEPELKNTGTISFHGKNHCTLNFVTSQVNFKKHGQCQNDDASTFELEHVPSAAEIWLFDNPDCDPSKANDFWLKLMTIKKDYTQAPIDFDLIARTPVGSVVLGAPGLRLIDSHVRPGGQTHKKLSCVKIIISPQP